MSLKSYIKRGITYVIKGAPTKYVNANITYSSPRETLKGKNIVVTGGGRGLGFSMAKKFVEEGARVLICGRNESVLMESAQNLNCQYLVLDVQDVSSFEAFYAKADELLGGVNCLVNNAGVSLYEHSFCEVTEETFDIQVNTNLKGAFFMAQKFIQLLEKENRGGTVLFVSSEAGATADIRPYGLTKAAINSLVKGLASMYAPKGIRVNAIAPGITVSGMTGYNAEENLYHPKSAVERVYLPEEVAECACFLLSDLSGCVSGEILTCNNAKTVNARWK